MSLPTKVRKGVNHPMRVATYLMMKLQQSIGKRFNYGLRPFDRDWDVLVVLDACRYDLFEEVTSDHPVSKHFSTIESVYSCGTATPEWLQKSLVDTPTNNLSQTHLITANGHTENICDADRFYDYTPLWKYSVENTLTVVPPSVVTNAAVQAFRDSSAEKYIVHYLQPHAPFIHCINKYKGIEEDEECQVWEELRHGKVNFDTVWNDYAKNLSTVLNEVQKLIENAAGTVVVTSDHGNGMGELGVYGHPLHSLQPSLKRVPWAEARGKELDTYNIGEPDEDHDQLYETNVEEHLQNLGYIT